MIIIIIIKMIIIMMIIRRHQRLKTLGVGSMIPRRRHGRKFWRTLQRPGVLHGPMVAKNTSTLHDCSSMSRKEIEKKTWILERTALILRSSTLPLAKSNRVTAHKHIIYL